MTDTHNIIMQNRSKISVTGVTDVFGFNDETVFLATTMGALRFSGSHLRITRISLQTGEAEIEGTVNGVVYTKGKQKKEPFLTRLFR